MIKVQKLLPAIGLLLSLVIVTPNIMIASVEYVVTQIQTPTLISTETKNSVKTMVVFNQTLVANEFIRTEEWTNGTKVHISEHFILNDPTCHDVWVNCTTWFNTRKASQVTNYSTKQQAFTTSGVYPWKAWIDGLLFLLKGNNGTHLVSYDHDDNYDTYYPQEWYRAFNLIGTQMSHIHLPTDYMTDWYNGVKDKETIIGSVFAILGGTLSIIGGVAAVLHCPWVAVPAILGGIASIVGAILVLLGFTESRWIRDVVTEKFNGDGWTWMGAIDGFPVLWWWCPFLNKPITIYDFYEVRYWQQSWGAEGALSTSPQEYTVAWWSKRETMWAPTVACLPPGYPGPCGVK